VIIGPHTVLTASHLLWNIANWTEANQVWVYPAYNRTRPGRSAPSMQIWSGTTTPILASGAKIASLKAIANMTSQ
jgi:hypothetical protein